jgi:signal transduction histidine kinase/ligand-binding sensor domain-containing protein
MKRSLIVVFFALSLTTFGQFHTTFNFSVPDGLPSSEVYEVFQDRKGFLWFATDNGVARYDGNEFRVFHVKDGLTDPVVFGFFEDDYGRVWFRTFSGKICYFNGQTIEPYQFNDQLMQNGENGLFRFLYNSENDDLWFSLEFKLGKIDSEGRNIRVAHFKRSLFLRSIGDSFLMGADTQYSIKNIIIDDQRFPIQLTDTSDFKFFNAIKYQQKIYVSIYRDVFEYDNSTLRRIYTSSAPIISLSTDKEDNLWLGYLNNGAEIFKGTRKGWRPEFLRNKSVTKVLQDHDLGLWFSTLESGVYHAPNIRINNYHLPTPSRLKAVLSLGDSVLVGDQSGHLFLFDAQSKKIVNEKIYEHAVYSLFQDRNKNVWVSAAVDMLRYDRTFKLKNIYPQRIGTSFVQDPDGSIWTLSGIRITHFDEQGAVLKSDAPNVIYRTLFVDDSVIYLAARTGLHLRDKELRLLEVPPAFSEYKITQIIQINDTTLLLSTQGNGLLLVNKETWDYKRFDTENRFVANNIYCITKTDSTLWIGTEKGLISIRIDDLLKNQLKFNHLSLENGLVGNKINFIAPAGREIWAFSDNGFSVVSEASAAYATSMPVFYIKNIIMGNDTLTLEKDHPETPLHLAYQNNHLTLSFGYIRFSNRDIFLRYRISDESAWTVTTERSLQFLSLAPGNYHFELQYSLDNIHWQVPFEPLPFTVGSPWWMKWYTIMGALLFILIMGYLYFRYRQSIYQQRTHYLSIINTHQQKLIQSEIETLERERKRIARELHDGVGTNLTAIKLMVSQLLQNHRVPQAAEIEEQFQIALRELKDIIYGLTPPSLGRYGLFTALKNYVSKLNKSLAPEISLQIFGNEIKNYEFNIMVFRIVQELISNSIKHSSAKHITIHINSFDDMLNIVYEDDGIGFSNDTFRGGLGLDNIESRIHSMNGNLRFESGNHGVSYTIDIPLKSINETV